MGREGGKWRNKPRAIYSIELAYYRPFRSIPISRGRISPIKRIKFQVSFQSGIFELDSSKNCIFTVHSFVSLLSTVRNAHHRVYSRIEAKRNEEKSLRERFNPVYAYARETVSSSGGNLICGLIQPAGI